ncbi:TPA: hypothetical protein DIC40_03160 [Patescibacteria group bacterium]|nr:hypothetical protein [Candidatus Gracilibacteria bacterium]
MMVIEIGIVVYLIVLQVIRLPEILRQVIHVQSQIQLVVYIFLIHVIIQIPYEQPSVVSEIIRQHVPVHDGMMGDGVVRHVL